MPLNRRIAVATRAIYRAGAEVGVFPHVKHDVRDAQRLVAVRDDDDRARTSQARNRREGRARCDATSSPLVGSSRRRTGQARGRPPAPAPPTAARRRRAWTARRGRGARCRRRRGAPPPRSRRARPARRRTRARERRLLPAYPRGGASLWHPREGARGGAGGERLEAGAAVADRPRERLVEPEERAEERRLAAPGRPHDRHDGPRRDAQREISPASHRRSARPSRSSSRGASGHSCPCAFGSSCLSLAIGALGVRRRAPRARSPRRRLARGTGAHR